MKEQDFFAEISAHKMLKKYKFINNEIIAVEGFDEFFKKNPPNSHVIKKILTETLNPTSLPVILQTDKTLSVSEHCIEGSIMREYNIHQPKEITCAIITMPNEPLDTTRLNNNCKINPKTLEKISEMIRARKDEIIATEEIEKIVYQVPKDDIEEFKAMEGLVELSETGEFMIIPRLSYIALLKLVRSAEYFEKMEKNYIKTRSSL